MHTFRGKITGLTCDACVALITKRFKKIPGIETVAIERETGDTTIGSTLLVDTNMLNESLAGLSYQVLYIS